MEMFSKRKTNLRLSFFLIKKETKNQGFIKMAKIDGITLQRTMPRSALYLYQPIVNQAIE